ncbi:MAG: DMT family transporter [Methylovirgula sp.]
MSFISFSRAAKLNLLPIYIGAFCLIWSFAFTAGKVAVTDCPPLILLAGRFLVAGVLIFAFAAVRREKGAMSRRDIGVFTLLGVVNYALYLSLGYIGLQTVSAGLGGLITSANPILTAIFAATLLGETLNWRKIAGLVLGVAGVAFIVAHRLSIGSDGMRGILFSLASLVSLVAGTILFRLFAPKSDLWMGNGIQNIAAGLVLAPIALTASNVGDIVPSTRLFLAFAFLVLGGSILGFLLWFRLLVLCGATVASSFHFLMPPLGILFAWLVLGEHIVALDLLGILPVALGIYLVTRPGAEAAEPTPLVESVR